MNKDQITAKLEEIIQTVNAAQADVSAGIVKNLSHMDKDVAKICEEIVKLPQEEAAQVQPIMADMITRLEALAQSLQNFKSQFDQG